ncbi:25102_t:CDS:2 [Gigaspora rosea]|nr:25102_t:CDS:2 [Gigaspora rosea]
MNTDQTISVAMQKHLIEGAGFELFKTITRQNVELPLQPKFSSLYLGFCMPKLTMLYNKVTDNQLWLLVLPTILGDHECT